jgi:light-independent protochlorophyllide reductase subunit N
VLALHTAYLVALFTGGLAPQGQMLLALAAYAAYLINAAQFLLKLRAARPDEARRAPVRCPRWRRSAAGLNGMHGLHEAGARDEPVIPLHAESASGCATAPVLRERGQREVFCGLTGIVWLHRKIQDAFFLVVGSRTCAHLIQSAAGVMIFAEPRFATAIIDERDLAGLADADEELDRVVARLLERRPDIQHPVPGGLLPVGGDQARPRARRRAAEPALPCLRVRVLNYSGSGIETTFTQGEDACLAALVPGAARQPRRTGRAAGGGRAGRCGRRPVRAGCSARWGIGPAWPSCRRARSDACQRWGRGTRFLLAQPFLGDTARALRGARRACAWPPFPLGDEGTTAWLQAGARPWASAPRHVRGRARRRRANAPRAALARLQPRLRGKRIFFFPDSQLEIPIARFLARELGMRARSRSARPTCTASMLADELALLPGHAR